MYTAAAMSNEPHHICLTFHSVQVQDVQADMVTQPDLEEKQLVKLILASRRLKTGEATSLHLLKEHNLSTNTTINRLSHLFNPYKS